MTEPTWEEIDQLMADRNRVILERDDARAEVARLRKLLAELEWSAWEMYLKVASES